MYVRYQTPSIQDLACNNINIQPTPTDTGSVQIISIPELAQIFIDGVEQDLKTPAIIENIPSGLHTYKLVYPGYVDIEGIMTIETGETYELFLVMEKEPSPYSNALILTGLAIMGVMILSYEKERRT
jgi:hypothetical protein